MKIWESIKEFFSDNKEFLIMSLVVILSTFGIFSAIFALAGINDEQTPTTTNTIIHKGILNDVEYNNGNTQITLNKTVFLVSQIVNGIELGHFYTIETTNDTYQLVRIVDWNVN